MKEEKVGMVLGKFLPPHSGHRYLCEFAENYVDRLYIIVGTLESEPIPGDVRFAWMKQLFPSSIVLHLDEELPQEPSEHPNFWQLWKNALNAILPETPDLVFASESYGHPLASHLGASFIPVDPGRVSRPVSGTAIRNKPFANWEHIPRVVRPWFLKRFCIFGPESTGKSTLAANLAKAFATIFVPEYARTYLEEFGTELSEEILLTFARGQAASETSLSLEANRVLFVDSDPLLTSVWSNALFGKCQSKILQLAEASTYDHYFVTDVDVPWIDDRFRYLPEKRVSFRENCINTLEGDGRPYTLLSGDWEERFATASSVVSRISGLEPTV